MQNRCNFSYEHYLHILEKAKKIFTFVKFHEFNEKIRKKQLILRHDVDFCVESAYKIAKIEYENGIQSTFFLLVTSPFYNIFADYERELIIEILEMGHDLGLHYYIPEKIINRNDQIKYVIKQIKILEIFFDTKIKVLSSHLTRRSKNLLTIKGFFNVHNPKFFNQIKYISDSLQKWRGSCICKQLNNHDKIQLLIHPIWWNTTSENWLQQIKKASQNKIERIEVEYGNTIELYKDGLKRRKQLDNLFLMKIKSINE